MIGAYFLCTLSFFMLIGVLVIYLSVIHLPEWERIMTCIVVAWEFVIYSYTALRNPGIASNPRPSLKIDEEFGSSPM